MKKTYKSRESSQLVGANYLIHSEHVNKLVGEVLTFIEAMGLKESQESSAKDILKQKIRDIMDYKLYVPDGLAGVCLDAMYDEQNHKHNADTPLTEDRMSYELTMEIKD